MRALVLRDFLELVVTVEPDPVPGEGETLVRVLYTGICGTDVHGFTGENGRRVPGQIMGHETVGRVVGAESDFGDGSLVTVNPVISCMACAACEAGREQHCAERRIIGVTPDIRSAFADYVVVPTRNVVPLSDAIPVQYGALVEPLAVGQHAVARGGSAAADGVLIVGGGPIGQACTLAARRAGATVVVSEIDHQRRQLVAALGAATIDPTVDDVASATAAALGRPADMAIDAVGSSQSLAACLAATATGSRVVLVGMNEPTPEIPAFAISTGERSVVGSFVYSAREFAETAAWVSTAPADLELLVEKTVGLTEAGATFADAAGGRNGPGKILVAMDQTDAFVSSPQ
ncbi:zinc-binding alcohol dehydrogenase [Kribbella pittospori]|uniref:Zinc-binding alcohol dehydrogenase n=1 Tax=Kribbella pittospori TaxID=722689 RepID=A0A4R0JXU1_9ACTN|nr:alcohol dehydrogenase catalytic domain-containing protein [Kribbella pittospori]TCC51487.1 zinc-binding alcohol dehydrogenase [Kribbella pittospori]